MNITQYFLTICLSWACSDWAIAWVDKGLPNVDDVKVSWNGNIVIGTATLNGELKDNTYLCPVMLWECFAQDGTRVGLSGNIDATCEDDKVARKYVSNPIKVSELCHMRFTLQPRSGRKPLIGWARKPIQWE